MAVEGPTQSGVKVPDRGTSLRAVPPRLSFELAPPVMAGNRPTACGVLHKLLASDEPFRRTASADQALVLAAMWYRLAGAVLDDLALAPAWPDTRRWRHPPELAHHPRTVSATDLTWEGVKPVGVRPLPHLHRLLWALPEKRLEDALRWAPPVLLSMDRKGPYHVVANHFSALIVRQRHPGAHVKVYAFTRAVAWQGHALPELCQAIVQALWPLYRDHERRIVELARDEAEAAWLTGYGRAQYFRIRRAVSARKP